MGLLRLRELRGCAGGAVRPDPELGERDLEDLANELEEFIDEVDVRIGSSK